MDEVFPIRPNVDFSKLKLTEEGEYSVTRRRDADRIINIMKHVVGNLKTKSITDATGCVGGDTIHFGLNFHYVNSIEINKENFEALYNNVKEYNLQNVNVHNGDAVTLFNWSTDVLYIDPPWGGPNYREQKNLDLFVSEKRIDEWITEILLRRNRPSYIFLKLPNNYNFERFTTMPNIEHIKPYRIRTYILVAIKVHINPNKNPRILSSN